LDLGFDVVAAYEEAEEIRRERLWEAMTTRAVPYAVFEGSRGIRSGLVGMTGVFARAG
jgi:hypothetical protein